GGQTEGPAGGITEGADDVIRHDRHPGVAVGESPGGGQRRGGGATVDGHRAGRGGRVVGDGGGGRVGEGRRRGCGGDADECDDGQGEDGERCCEQDGTGLLAPRASRRAEMETIAVRHAAEPRDGGPPRGSPRAVIRCSPGGATPAAAWASHSHGGSPGRYRRIPSRP